MPAKLLMRADEIAAHPDEWTKRRRGSIGASEVAVLLGLAPRSHGSPFSLFVEKKTGERTGTENNDMERGRVLETYVTERFANMRPDLAVLPGGLYQDENCPWMTASFDRFAVSRDAAGSRLPLLGTSLADYASNPGLLEELRALMIPAEVKTAISKNDEAGRPLWGEPYTSEVPAHYKCQAYWQMQIWGADMVYMPVQFMGSWKTELYVVQRTDDAEADIAFMVAEAATFLERLDRDDPPDLDWTPETARALRTLHPVEPDTTYRATLRDARRLRTAYKRMKDAERKYGLIQNQVAAKAGGAQHIVVPDPQRDGKNVNVMNRVTVPGKKRVDLDRMRKERPADVARYEVPAPVDYYTPGQRWMKLP